MSERIVNVEPEEHARNFPEIVRCRDCKHREPLEGERGDWCYYWTDKVYGDGDGFCSWGERMVVEP